MIKIEVEHDTQTFKHTSLTFEMAEQGLDQLRRKIETLDAEIKAHLEEDKILNTIDHAQN